MKIEASEQRLAIELSVDEALILHSWLASRDSGDMSGYNDQAQQRVLWDLEAVLEQSLTEPFISNYPESLDAACQRLRDSTK